MSRKVRVFLVIALLAGIHDIVSAQVEPAQRLSANGASETPTGYQREQIRLREAELEVEKLKLWTTGGSIVIPLLAAVLAFWLSRKNQIRQVDADYKLKEAEIKADFQLKAAEIAMAARTSWDAKGRAVALNALFPGKLPAGLGENFDPEKYTWGRESRRELVALLAANPEHRTIIADVWQALFPHDTWINDLPHRGAAP